MYTTKNFPSKKALKDAVKNGERITVYSPSPFADAPTNGRVCLEGPHFPKPHCWYAEAVLKDGVIVSVK